MRPTETRAQRIERLKNKFRRLGGPSLLKEYVRYERAKDGQLPHPFPADYVEEIMEALEQLIREKFDDDGKRIVRYLEILRKKDPQPFLPK